MSEAGIRLKVESADQKWVRQTFMELSDEIDKGVPRWAFMRSTKATLICSFGSMAIILLAIVLSRNPYLAFLLVASLLVFPGIN